MSGVINRLAVIFADALLSLYFRYCGLSKSTVHLDGNETTMCIWGTNHRRCDKPNLVLIHGFGGNSKWQFVLQETLLIWGEKDKVFPLDWGYQLQRHFGGKSKLEIIRNVGHAANFEAPCSLNRYITSFVLGSG